MKKCLILAQRNAKEMLREPLSLVFCLGFPLVMLLVMQLIFSNMALGFTPPNFEIENYAIGICVFGYTFTCLFVAMQIAGDKNTAFMKRLNVSPIRKVSYYCSFLISALPMVFMQTVLFFLIALFFGFPFNGYFFLSIVYLLPSALLYIGIGIFIGCICKNEKQTGPISSVFISLTGILGGIFMPIGAFKGGFATFINLLPFSHSVSIASELHAYGAKCIYPHVLYLLFYIAVLAAATALIETLKSRKR